MGVDRRKSGGNCGVKRRTVIGGGGNDASIGGKGSIIPSLLPRFNPHYPLLLLRFIPHYPVLLHHLTPPPATPFLHRVTAVVAEWQPWTPILCLEPVRLSPQTTDAFPILANRCIWINKFTPSLLEQFTPTICPQFWNFLGYFLQAE